MAANTATWSLTYPQSTDDVRPYEDIQELALDVDAALTSVYKPPGCIATRVAAFSLPNNSTTLIPWDTQVFDNASMFAPTSTTITITVAGVYLVSAGLTIVASATGIRSVDILQNGASCVCDARSAPSAFDARATVTGVTLCIVGDTFTLAAYQASGSAQNTTGRFAVMRLSGV